MSLTMVKRSAGFTVIGQLNTLDNFCPNTVRFRIRPVFFLLLFLYLSFRFFFFLLLSLLLFKLNLKLCMFYLGNMSLFYAFREI